MPEAISSSSASLALRSLFWTIAFPGMVAGYVPWRVFGLADAQVDWRRPSHVLGLFCIAIGTLLLAACIVEFAKSGRGTLSPADPPRHLVVRGLYRHVRNPMYLSVTTILLGEAALMQSRDLVIYWVIWFVAVNLFVVGYEEPMLRQRFGDSYDEYTRHVGRWLPRLRS
jgi:protein-S-isoprenylcysteine O-methyltransferase Ste14